jgi:serine/threonine-protein kinase
MEIEYWRSIEASKDPADFQAYLARYPNGNFADLAKNRLAKLREPPDPCQSLPGLWSWFIGGDVQIDPGGTLKNASGFTGVWTCKAGAVRIVWSHGMTDNLTLSADGAHLRGQGGLLGAMAISGDKK